MADRKASEEGLADTLLGTEFWGAVQSGNDVRMTAAQLATFVMSTGAVRSVNTRTGDVVLTKADVNLGNVQNVDQTNASNITSGTLDEERVDALIARKVDIKTDIVVSATSQISSNARILAVKLASDLSLVGVFEGSTSHVDAASVTTSHVFTIRVLDADFITPFATLGTLTWNVGQPTGVFARDAGIGSTPFVIPANKVIEVRSGNVEPTFSYCGFTLSLTPVV